MKKSNVFVVIMASALMIGGLVGCGNNPSGNKNSSSNVTEDYEKDYDSFPDKGLKTSFESFGYEGFEIPALDASNAIYSLTEDPENWYNMCDESCFIQIRQVPPTTFENYPNILTTAGWTVEGSQASKVTNNGTATFSFSIDSRNIVKLIIKLRKTGEILRSWPTKSLRNRLAHYNVDETVPPYTGTNYGFDWNINTGFSFYRSETMVVIDVADGREAKSAEEYNQTLVAAKWTKNGTVENFDRYISPKGQISITSRAYTSMYPGKMIIHIEPQENSTNPSGNSSKPNSGNNPSSNNVNSDDSQPIDSQGQNNSSQPAPSSNQGGNSFDPVDHSINPNYPANDDWPTAEVYTCLFKHGCTDQLPKYGVKGQYDVSENPNDWTWFKITATMLESEYEAYGNVRYHEVLTGAGFTENNNVFTSPNSQYHVDIYFHYGAGGYMIYEISVYAM